MRRNLFEIIGKISELHLEGNLTEEQLTEKMQEMLQGLSVKPIILSDKNNNNISIVLASDSCVHCMNKKSILDTAGSILNLDQYEVLDEEQLAEKIKEMAKVNNVGVSSGTKISKNKVSTGQLQASSKNSEQSEALEELDQRVGNLEKKIDTLIEKLSKESSE